MLFCTLIKECLDICTEKEHDFCSVVCKHYMLKEYTINSSQIYGLNIKNVLCLEKKTKILMTHPLHLGICKCFVQ